MFEAQLSGLLKGILGDYVRGIDREALKLSVWKGDVELKNIQLRPEAFNVEGSAFTVVSGVAGRIKLKVPWKKLGSKPVVVEIDRVYILANESADEAPEKDEEDEFGRKQDKLDEREASWVASRSVTSEKDKTSTKKKRGWFAGLIDTILGNIELTISNVHIRLEGSTFTAGAFLRRLAAKTVDENGKEKFSVGGLANRMHKNAALERLAVYLDTGGSPLAPKGTRWQDVTPQRWDDMFLKGIENDSDAPERCYILYPSDCRAQYTRRGNKETSEDMAAFQNVSVSLSSFNMRMTRKQFLEIEKASNTVSVNAAKKNLPWLQYRPASQPEESPQEWWAYAIKAVKSSWSKVDWSAVMKAAQERAEYVKLHRMKIDSNSGSSNDIGEEAYARIDEIEGQYDIEVLLLWRKMANLHSNAGQRQQEQSKPRRRLFGLGRRRKAAKQGEGDQNEDKEFSQDDVAKLQDMLKVDEAAPSESTKDPFSIMCDIKVDMQRGSLHLMNGSTNAIESSLDQLSIGARIFPTTQQITAAIDTYSVSSDGESVIRNGINALERGERDHKGTHTDHPTGDRAEGETKAINFKVISKPQDGRCDTVVSATVAPTLVAATPRVVANVVAFFNVPADMDTSALKAAGARAAQDAAERAKQAAQSQLEDNIAQHPSLELSIEIQAPKLAACASGRTAFLDFGHFNIVTGNERGQGETGKHTPTTAYNVNGRGIAIDMLCDETWSWHSYLTGGLMTRSLLTPAEISASFKEEGNTDTGSESAGSMGSNLTVNLKLKSSELHASPSAATSMMEIVNSFQRTLESKPAGTAPGASVRPRRSWAQSPELEGDAKILTWASLGTRGQWQPAYFAKEGAKLFVAKTIDAPSPMRQMNLRAMRTACRPGKEECAWMENVVALSHRRLSSDEITKYQDSVLVALPTDASARNLCKAIRRHISFGEAATDIDEASASEAHAKSSSHIEASTMSVTLLLEGFGVTIASSLGDAAETPVARLQLSDASVKVNASKLEQSMSLRLGSLSLQNLETQKREEDADSFILKMLRNERDEASELSVLAADVESISPQSPHHAGVDTRVNVCIGLLSVTLHPEVVKSLSPIIYELQENILSSKGSNANPAEVKDTATQTDKQPKMTNYEEATNLLKRPRDQALVKIKLDAAGMTFTLKQSIDVALASISIEGLDGSMVQYSEQFYMKSTLSSMSIIDASLPEDHMHRHVLSLSETGSPNREGDNRKLADVELTWFSSQESAQVDHDMSINGKVARTELVFRNKFLGELQSTIRGLIPPPGNRMATTDTKTQPKQQAPSDADVTSETSQLAVKVNVGIEAPRVTMPRGTDGNEKLAVNLGTLKIFNTFDKETIANGTIDNLSIDISSITLGLIDKTGRPSSLNQGDIRLGLAVRRPLEQVNDIPLASVDLQVNAFEVCISSPEVRTITECITDNVNEPLELATSLAADEEEQRSQANLERSNTENMTTDRAQCQNKGNSNESTAPTEKKKTSVFLTLTLASVELTLVENLPGGVSNVGQLTIKDAWLSVAMLVGGGQQIRVALPLLEIRDRRPPKSDGVQTANNDNVILSKVGGNQHGNENVRQNLMWLEYLSFSEGARKPSLKLQIQQPRFSFDSDFILTIARFFVPSLIPGAEAEGVIPNDIVVEESTKMPGDGTILLGPRRRLLGDVSRASTLHFDGKGGRIDLLPCKEPVIIVGNNNRLVLHNVTIGNAERLSIATKLAPGSSISTLPENGVTLEKGNQTGLARDEGGRTLRRLSSIQQTVTMPRTNNNNNNNNKERADRAQSGSKQAEDKEVQQQQPSIQMNLTVAGMELVASKESTSTDEDERKSVGVLGSLRVSLETAEGGDQEITVGVTGLRIDQYRTCNRQHTDFLSLLEPADAVANISIPQKAPMDMKMTLSGIHVQLSLATLSLLQDIMQNAIVPLVATSPVVHTRSFDRVWVGGTEEQDRDESIVGFWAARPPSGYAMICTSANCGPSPPSSEIAVIRDLPSLCAKPVGFNLVWQDYNRTMGVWKPTPPEGFESIGCIATTGQSEPPVAACRCIRKELLCTSGASESLGMSNLAALSNSVQSAVSQEQKRLDLRVPLGARLTRATAEGSEKDNERGEQGSKERGGSQKAVIGVTVSEFTRLWTSKGTGSQLSASFWRPIAPEGYVILGDVGCPGLDIPRHSLAFKDTVGGYFAYPVGYKRLWRDADRSRKGLAFWQPIPPHGYKALGHVVHIGNGEAPSKGIVRCAHESLVRPLEIVKEHYRLWDTRLVNQKAGGVGSGAAVFTSDAGTGNFYLSLTNSPPEQTTYVLRSNRFIRGDGSSQKITCQAGESSFLFYDDSNRKRLSPVAQANFNDISVESSSFIGESRLKASISSDLSMFNPRVATFEPIVDGCNIVVLHQSTNSSDVSPRPSGNETSVSLTGVNGRPIRATLSAANINEGISRYVDTMKALEKTKASPAISDTSRSSKNTNMMMSTSKRQPMRATERESIVGGSTLENRYGETLTIQGTSINSSEMLVEDGESIELDPPDKANRKKARNSSKDRYDAMERFLFLDIMQLEGVSDEHKNRMINLTASINGIGRGATRAAKPDIGAHTVDWRERLLIETRHAEQETLDLALYDESNGSRAPLAVGSVSRNWSQIPSTKIEFAVQLSDGSSVHMRASKEAGHIAGADHGIMSGSSSSGRLNGNDNDRTTSQGGKESDRFLEISFGSQEGGRYMPMPKSIARAAQVTFAIEEESGNDDASAIVESKAGTITVRTPMRMSNGCTFPIEVGLRTKRGGEAKPGQNRSGASTRSEENQPRSMQVEVFENQRYQPLRGWGGQGFLMVADRSHYSSRDGSRSYNDLPGPPEGYEYYGGWSVDTSERNLDANGWSYGARFGAMHWPPSKGKGEPSTFDCVRRRRLVRNSQRIRNRDEEAREREAEEAQAEDEVESIGEIEQGFEMCLPVNALANTKEVCMRPLEEGQEKEFEWSKARLGCCTETGKISVGSDALQVRWARNAADTQARDKEETFFSAFTRNEQVQRRGHLKQGTPTGEGKPKSGRKAAGEESEEATEMASDWLITIGSPLTLQSLLPVKSRYTIQQEKRQFDGSIAPGKLKAVHGVDPGRQMFISFEPQEGGYRQKGGPVELQAGNSIDVIGPSGDTVTISMDVTTEMGVSGELMPVTLRLFVPFAIYNRTPLVLMARPAELAKDESRKSQAQSPQQDLVDDEPDDETFENVYTDTGSEELMNGEFTIGGGSTSLYSGPKAALALRLAGSKPAPPIELTASDKATVMHANLHGGGYAEVSIGVEPGQVGFEHLMAIAVDLHVSMTNRSGRAWLISQGSGEGDERTSISLPAGERRRPLIWKSKECDHCLRFKPKGNGGSAWSKAVAINKLGDAYLDLNSGEGSRQQQSGRGNNAIRISREQSSPSSFEIVIRDCGDSPPFCIENHTRQVLSARVQSNVNDWIPLEPRSSSPLFPGLLQAGEGIFLEVDPSSSVDTSTSAATTLTEAYELHPAMSQAAESLQPFSLGSGEQVSVQTFKRQGHVVLSVGSDRGPVASSIGLKPQRQSTFEQSFELQINSLEVSLIDAMPMEILLLSLDDMHLFYGTNLCGGSTSSLGISASSLQLDDQLPYSQFPVLVQPTGGEDKLISFHVVTKGSVADTTLISDLSFSVTESRIPINVHEPVIWKLVELYDSINIAKIYQLPMQAAVDPQLAIRALSLLNPSLRVKIGFKTESSGRPEKVSSLGRFGLTFANISNVRLRLRPLRLKQLTVRRSELISRVNRRVSRQLVSQALSLLTGVGILDSTSKAFSQAGDLLAWTTGEASQGSAQADTVQRGVLEGSKSVARGLRSGITGIVSKPIAGAGKSGAGGFFKGLGQGIVGVAASPAAGALRLVGSVTEGVSSTLDKGTKMLFGQANRRRPPLAITNDGIVRPYNEYEAVGQQILRLAQLDNLGFSGSVDLGGLFSSRGAFAVDKYECHLDLPKDRVALMTSRRVILLEKPGKPASLLSHPCSVKWQVEYSHLVDTCVTSGESQAQRSTMVSLRHRPNASQRLNVSVIQCHVASDQASELKSLIDRVAAMSLDDT